MACARLRVLSFAALLAGALVTLPSAAGAQGQPADGEHLRFSTPIITPSISPATLVRFDYYRVNRHSGADARTEQVIRVSGEYAFHRAVSIELEAPYATVEPDEGDKERGFDSFELALKFANFAFESSGVLLGYGIDSALPTGNDEKGIGSDHIVELEPFFSIGVKPGDLELIGFIAFTIPTALEKDDEVANDLDGAISALYRFSPGFRGLLELDGETVLNGPDAGESNANLTPGVKVTPLDNASLEIGFAISVHMSAEKQYDSLEILSLLYHF